MYKLWVRVSACPWRTQLRLRWQRWPNHHYSHLGISSLVDGLPDVSLTSYPLSRPPRLTVRGPSKQNRKLTAMKVKVSSLRLIVVDVELHRQLVKAHLVEEEYSVLFRRSGRMIGTTVTGEWGTNLFDFREFLSACEKRHTISTSNNG